MEILAVNEGLKIVEQKNLIPIEININSIEVLTMLATRNLNYDALIDEYRSRLRRLGNPEVSHSFRERNGVADVMAKQDANSMDFGEIRIFELSLICAANAVWADITRTFFEKKVKSCVIDSNEFSPSYLVFNLG